MSKNVFLHGPWATDEFLKTIRGGGSATLTSSVLEGYEAVCVNRCLAVRPKAQSKVEGVLWTGAPKSVFDRLFLIGRAFGLECTSVDVALANGVATAFAMASDPTASVLAWDPRFTKFLDYIADEIFDGGPDPQEKRLMQAWPMIEKRAWASVLAIEHAGPTSVRSAQTTDEVKFHVKHPRVGHFYRLQDTELSHLRFDGEDQGPLQREVFYGVDAVVVLPYDPLTDRILLIEQLRMGPLMRGDPHPWALEPIAGMIDAGEDPNVSALRETKEEAGLDLNELKLITANYPSPGSSTDFFYNYVGLCDLPQTGSYLGGLISENEDLKAHVMGFDAGIELVRSGEIQTGPLITLLYWLAMERPTLRQTA